MDLVHALQGRAPAKTGKPTDVRVVGAELYLLPVATRMPLRFGSETLTSVTCARVRLRVRTRDGRSAEGWGESPLNIEWSWPCDLSYGDRRRAMVEFCERITQAWADLDVWGHALEVGAEFQGAVLPDFVSDFNRLREPAAHLPLLAALVCCAPFDLALHDAYGRVLGVPTYETYDERFLSTDLAAMFHTDHSALVDLRGKFPSDFLAPSPPRKLTAWHTVGGLDPLSADELTGAEPNDGYPVLLADWIEQDGLTCLKIKLVGVDAGWDYDRLVRVGRIGVGNGVRWITADFNCSVSEPEYVNEVLDRLAVDEPQLYDMLAYVEQPFPYDLARYQVDVSSVARRKPLFMDESAHTWQHVAAGRSLGWTGVALKTCKTQTGAILSLCWAKAHGMLVMVQDLTNPMLAQIPHALLAAYARTGMGVETNAMQFYPRASDCEAQIHPGLYQRRGGEIDLATIHGPGFGYRIEEINRTLPAAVLSVGSLDDSQLRVDPPANSVQLHNI